MFQPKNLVGEKINWFIVVRDTKKRSIKRYVLWECLCDCGNIFYIYTDEIRKRLNCGECGVYTKFGRETERIFTLLSYPQIFITLTKKVDLL